MNLNEAARKLYDDQRRSLAKSIEATVNTAARETMAWLQTANHAIFDPRYCSVGGSTRRNTHLPGGSDFDILLVLSGAQWSGPYGEDNFPATVAASVNAYARRVGEVLSTNKTVCRVLAKICNCDSSKIVHTLRAEPYLKTWEETPLLVAKFMVNEFSFLEVSLGDILGHYVSLLYNTIWDEQLQRLSKKQQELTIAQVLLAKVLVQRRKLYGSQLPNLILSSRRIEQFVMQQVLERAERECPLRDACRRVANLTHYEQLLPLLTVPQSAFPTGQTETQLNSWLEETEKSLQNWNCFRQLAEDVAGGQIDYAVELT